MTAKQNIARVTAAVGILMLVHVGAADADELSDLRAQMAALRQKMDQLAQFAPGSTGGGAYGTKAVPGAGVVGGSFPRSFLIPGTETSIRIGGFADETLLYYLQNGPPNRTPSVTAGINGNLGTQALDVAGQVVPGYGTGFKVPVQINHSRGNGIFLESAAESRFNVETRTPTALGEVRTFIAIDFVGCNDFSCNQVQSVASPRLPRVRYAYGTLGGFLAGQVNSNFRDSDAEPETLDFGGPPGLAGVERLPQVRYTYNGPWGSAWSVALESPDTDVLTPAGRILADTNLDAFPVSNKTPGGVACEANAVAIPGTTSCNLGPNNPAMNKAPDLTFASYWARPWGHVNFRFVLRDLTWNDGQFVNRSLLGYGGGVSSSILPGWFGWAEDNIVWQINAGNGMGRYLNDSTDAGLATNYVVPPGCATPTPGCALAATSIIVTTIPSVGGMVGYQHFWAPTLRSTIAYGIAHYQVPSVLVGPVEQTVANKQLQSASVNLIWSPVAFIDIGSEYFWGQRKVVAGIFGNEQVLIGKFRLKY
jgi:hypothetical protein